MKVISFVALILVLGFLFLSILVLHPVGEPVGNLDVFKARSSATSDLNNIDTMDDYFLRNGQRETGANNIVTTVVFDYRGFDTLGEGTVLFIAVSAISMLLYQMLKKKKDIAKERAFAKGTSRIVGYAAFFLYPLIVIFGAYLVVHGHLTPGGGFQGGAVAASGTALLLVGALITRKSYSTRKIFSFFESFGLFIFIGVGFLGLGTAFLYNFLANGNVDFFGKTIEFGTNPGFINSAGTLPIVSLAVGIEVFFGISIILVALYNATKKDKMD